MAADSWISIAEYATIHSDDRTLTMVRGGLTSWKELELPSPLNVYLAGVIAGNLDAGSYPFLVSLRSPNGDQLWKVEGSLRVTDGRFPVPFTVRMNAAIISAGVHVVELSCATIRCSTTFDVGAKARDRSKE